nr:immunoglobulin light chain junction region [Macaca mulatta]MOX84253.1 immunoglobulin light chain junction region [Macaca mulatta]
DYYCSSYVGVNTLF